MSIIFQTLKTVQRSQIGQLAIPLRQYSQMVTFSKGQTPPPTDTVPDVATFLEKIGRDAQEHTDAFENDWETFWKLGSAGMKEKGIDVAARKYILDWQERYRKGTELYHIKQGKKKFDGKGERYFKVYRALKRREARIAEKELRERWKSEHPAN
ncbi:unnamed protein product [Kuraishia capsulata CBS 1993]|uniref:Small ribosomal subunit protein mS41 n=1 Tax=Kuraishia capsulata CBS 1993 TaxID=1382522 RepID=W6MUK3_9ASCO|nr:uncharacterized protein KUCA_T00005340001 [Kuraishia capsulata CBS 1993]CDK29352.1 unnamed protein product [Kuraishia capsulata CBS 1993]